MSYGEILKKIKQTSPTLCQELDVRIGTLDKKVFLQNGFYVTPTRQILHEHSYAEIHIFLGRARLTVNGTTHSISGATLAIVPKNSYHTFHADKDTKHTAFQIDVDTEFATKKVAEELLNELFYEIKKSKESESYSKVSSYISFLCSYFIDDSEKIDAKKITDYAFLINEFLSLRYIEDIKLADLAKELRVSEKQAHRLVLKHTGTTFGNELASRRMKAAEQLMKDGRFSMTEIAESVGYQTYSGFWKAYKKYKKDSE